MCLLTSGISIKNKVEFWVVLAMKFSVLKRFGLILGIVFQLASTTILV